MRFSTLSAVPTISLKEFPNMHREPLSPRAQVTLDDLAATGPASETEVW